MSYTTITQATRDEPLQDRVQAAACKEAWAGGAEFMMSEYGERLRTYPQEAITTFMWAVAIDYEADYAYAVDAGNENPGGDPGVIGDNELQAAVQAHWPRDAQVPLPPAMTGPTPARPVLPAQPIAPVPEE
jgi:hypothetical protein